MFSPSGRWIRGLPGIVDHADGAMARLCAQPSSVPVRSEIEDSIGMQDVVQEGFVCVGHRSRYGHLLGAVLFPEQLVRGLRRAAARVAPLCRAT